MTQSQRYTDTSLEKVLHKATEELKVPKEQLEYKVVEDKKGLMGLGNKITAEVWVKEITIAGSAAIRDGKLIISPPGPGGLKARIKPGAKMQVHLNGEEITGVVEVSPEDDIQIELQHQEPQTDFEIVLSEDKMEALLKVKKTNGFEYKLEDCEPKEILEIKAVLAQEIEPGYLPIEEVVQELQRKKIVYGVDAMAINEALGTKGSKEFVIAKGKKGKYPVDETVEYHFAMECEHCIQDENARVDHRERTKIPTVTPGDLLATKTPPKLGEEGMDVTGKVWTPPMPKTVDLKPGKGVQLQDGGIKAVATIDGKPELKGKMLTVVPIYQVGSVDLDSGNITFNGTVIVQRNVEEGMKVTAKDGVEVNGSVNNATVMAGSSVVINKNVFASKVSVGGETVIYQSIHQHIKDLPVIFSQMQQKAKIAREALLKKKGEDVSEGYIIVLMLEKMYPQVQKSVLSLQKTLESESYQIEEQVEKVVEILKQSLLGLGPSKLNFATLRKIGKTVDQALFILEELRANTSDITASYVQNSVIKASGNVFITGKGCYNSKINSGGQVTFTGRPGVFRGGEIYANGDVIVGEIGTPSGTMTSITVPKDAKIKANKIYPNVVITVGKFSEKIQNFYGNFEAWVSERGLETVKLKEK
ncbi:hypothetical protein GGQ84_000571 [Desulfitispora alkaliphila]|uniref:flagellar assembly protein A n=1 Tax=Desulfitispora alkaliphila TaxID=622674 RepID=UPI003D23E700